jgi:hypothetical protein
MSYPFTLSGFQRDTDAPRPLETGCTCTVDTTSRTALAVHRTHSEMLVMSVSEDCPHHANRPYAECEPPRRAWLPQRMRHHHIRYRRKWAKR